MPRCKTCGLPENESGLQELPDGGWEVYDVDGRVIASGVTLYEAECALNRVDDFDCCQCEDFIPMDEET